ncbi:AraC family transcriptional regulator [Variovorax sp. PBL-E5]|uniref:AraC family transcriptional regulator n=1 Tax=Variovorax sp. PBL-E5 TaxID=434014 RepID=UPI001317FF08|nr:helix-turn-helix transcriptional regulator [Variovorax sp. PBL-E5]VTU20897.1 HTH-type transcriptional repressor of iron proteins A [Variovorax sp. PBL-E5]
MDQFELSAHHISELEHDMGAAPMVGLSMEIPAGTTVEPHEHGRGQLMFSSSGVMVIEGMGGSWVVPPQRAVWVPHHVRHTFHPATNLSLRNLLIRSDVDVPLPTACTFVRVTPLLRELILRVVEDPSTFRSTAHHERAIGLLFDEIDVCQVAPLLLPLPQDPRIRRICIALRENPADPRTLEDWADIACASGRTLTRLFLKETGVSFAHWRRQARLMAAMVRLGMGDSVTSTALDVGYESASAFIEMFRRTIGQTPGQYFN